MTPDREERAQRGFATRSEGARGPFAAANRPRQFNQLSK
jgi:hypothetical protein